MGKPDDAIRVLHLTANYESLGLGRYLLGLCHAMRRDGHDITIAGDPGLWRQRFDWSFDDFFLGLPIWGSSGQLWRSYRALRRYLSEHPVDVLHTHCRWSTLVARALCKERPGLPVLQTLHSAGWPLSKRNRWLWDFGDHAHAASELARAWLVESARMNQQQITVIPHGVEPDRYPVADEAQWRQAREGLWVEPDATLAVYIGQLKRDNHVEWMLDLAQTPQTRIAKLRVLIVGDGPHKQHICDRIKYEGLSQRVVLLDRCDLLKAYCAADAVMLPTQYEGFSWVCAEAMSVGRPVFRTRTGGCPEQIIEGITGRSVPVERSTFVEGAVRFLSDREALVRMGQQAAKHVRETLTFERQLEQTEALYRRLIASYARYRDQTPSPSPAPSPEEDGHPPQGQPPTQPPPMGLSQPESS